MYVALVGPELTFASSVGAGDSDEDVACTVSWTVKVTTMPSSLVVMTLVEVGEGVGTLLSLEGEGVEELSEVVEDSEVEASA